MLVAGVGQEGIGARLGEAPIDVDGILARRHASALECLPHVSVQFGH